MSQEGKFGGEEEWKLANLNKKKGKGGHLVTEKLEGLSFEK